MVRKDISSLLLHTQSLCLVLLLCATTTTFVCNDPGVLVVIRYDNQDEPVLTPYDRYRFYEKDVFLNGRSYDEFIFTFSDNFSRPDIPAAERTCLPTECSQASTYILWGTCWNNPSGLPWEGSC